MTVQTAVPSRRTPVPAPARGLPVRLADALWGLLTSVDFAVLQIIVLALMAVVGMVVRQLPGFAFRSPTDYTNEMAKLHDVYDATLGAGVVDILERLQVFQVFTSTWFSVAIVVLILSIVACTIDRTPRLWRQAADVRVEQPDAYFDPRLPDRALMAGVDADSVARVLRRHHFKVRRSSVAPAPVAPAPGAPDTASGSREAAPAVGAADAVTYLYGDRNQWTKLATLVTHAGLILFLVAAAVTARLGFEQGLVVAEGQTLSVQPIGTPGLLLVRNLGFEAPGFETGHPTDFTTHLAVYQGGRQVAEKVIRVNDPLEVDGYTFHQNGFGPAPDLVIRDQAGKPLWDAPVPMTDVAAGSPFVQMTVPGRDVVLQMVLRKAADGAGVLLLLPFRAQGTNADGSQNIVGLQPAALEVGESATPGGTDFTIELRGFGQYTLLIAKKDPGAPIVWLACVLLVGGLLITFWMPRRRVWARLDADGRLALVVRTDRYVDVGREFGAVLEDLVRARRDIPHAADGRRP